LKPQEKGGDVSIKSWELHFDPKRATVNVGFATG
jgi:hypothetical protein